MLTPQQFAEWQAFYKIEPWGFQTDDMQFSFTRKMMADVMGAKKRNGQPITIEDVSLSKMFSEQKAPKTQSVEEMKAILLALAGGKEENNG